MPLFVIASHPLSLVCSTAIASGILPILLILSKPLPLGVFASLRELPALLRSRELDLSLGRSSSRISARLRCNSGAMNQTEYMNPVIWGMFIGSMVGISFGTVFGSLAMGIGLGPLFGALGGLIYTIVRDRRAHRRP